VTGTPLDGQRPGSDDGGLLALTHCELCPRRCGVNRLAGQLGFCRAGSEACVYSFGPHHGEEPPLSGRRGSGTVFFSHCTLSCVYCQNYQFSQQGLGELYSNLQLASVLEQLRSDGCHNWNLVSPTPWLPMIMRALQSASLAGQRLPVVYNTSGYERIEVLRALEGNVDVYLTDLRYASEAVALRGSGVPDYVSHARAALLEMWRQTGELLLDDRGLARRGLICRILILPGLASEACQTLEWLAASVGLRVAISVMAQYTPAYLAAGTAGWDRRITASEYDSVRRCAQRLGFERGWIQGLDGAMESPLAGFRMPARFYERAREEARGNEQI
jgi:putative pyruvate formate lyase activating enzyme